MQPDFYKILEIVRNNVQSNPWISDAETEEVAPRYLQGIIDETGEVRPELKENNQVYLTDELSDIAWDYLTLLSVLEARGWIESVDAVFAHGYSKYAARAPLGERMPDGHWSEVKKQQKVELQKLHQEKYGA